MKGYPKINVWIMTPDGAAKAADAGAKGFAIRQTRDGDALTMRLAGRLDSISAPELLAAFRAADGESAVKDVMVDLQDLEYTSSAGLRVMLIMYNQLGQGHFRLLHVNDTVGAILRDTGFDQVFLA